VDEVSSNSPASQAGLAVGDLVFDFGGITKQTSNGLKALADLVRDSENRAVHLTVKRNGKNLHLTLTPRKWEGRGLLGYATTARKTTRKPTSDFSFFG
jgi:26S proteasome non-ATPase regulatory subunit 9